MITSKVISFIVSILINFQLIAANQRISAIKCKEYENVTQIPYYVRGHPSFPANKVFSDLCQHNGAALIKGGERASLFEFPHQALLGYKKGKDRIQWHCGGSLVSPNFVLTAAHCLGSSGLGQVKFVKLGMLTRSQSDNYVQIYNVEEKFKHENYSPRTNENDIALLKLNDTVKFNTYLYPICLPTQQHYGDALATGFGKTGGVDAESESLLKVGLQHFSFETCRNRLGVLTERVFRDIMICYGHRLEKKDTCKGDSGGPLQIFNDDVSKCTYTQIGVVSFGPSECGTTGIPSVYANVYHYLDWIEGIVWKDEI